MDIALKRDKFFDISAELLTKLINNEYRIFITSNTITDIYYITKKSINHNLAILFIEELLEYTELISISREMIIDAIKNNQKDFEDAIQIEAANGYDIKVIITRNIDDFRHSSLQIYTPSEFLKIL